MRLGILSRNPTLYSTMRLERAALERGHTVRILDASRCCLIVDADGPRVSYLGEPLALDALLARVGASQTHQGAAVVRHLSLMGVPCFNSAEAILASRDKLAAMQRLAQAGLPQPPTAFGGSTRDTAWIVQQLGGAPVVVKVSEGTHGSGVVRAGTEQEAEAMVGALRSTGAWVVVQHFVAEARGRDVRAFVVGGDVVAAMQRQAAAGEFRANLHLGARAAPVTLSDEEREVAARAARAFGLHIAGVDLVRSEAGPMVLEVNSSPGLEGIEETSGIDLATAIVRHVEAEVEAVGAGREPERTGEPGAGPLARADAPLG
jgi:ribosomal protein S6--L-glutamate ligase